MPIWSYVQISSSTDTIRPNRPIFSPRLYDFNLNGFGTFDSSLHAEVHLDMATFDPRGKFLGLYRQFGLRENVKHMKCPAILAGFLMI